MSISFDNVEVDLANFELRRDGVRVPVEPKVFDLIRFMVENPNRLISKDDLINAIWDGRIVSDAALSTVIKNARRALSEGSLNDSRITTVRGRGFRLNLPESEMGAGVSESKTATPGRPDDFVDPSFVVLPPKGEIEDISVQLQRRLSRNIARLPFLNVAAPRSVDRFKDASIEELGEAFGAGFALEIIGQKSGNQVQLDCLLFELKKGVSIWNYETKPFAPAMDLDDVIVEIAVHLQPQLMRAVYASILASGTAEDPRALTLQGLGTMSLRGWNRAAFDEAEGVLRKAVADKKLPQAHAALALVLAVGQEMGLAHRDQARRDEAVLHADQAISLDGMAVDVLGLAGCALCDAGQGLRGKTILKRALSIDESDPQSLAALGTQLFREGDTEQAIELLDRAVRSVPQDSTIAVWGSILALALLRNGDTTRALEMADRAVAADDQTHLSRIVMMAVQAARNDQAAAKSYWEDARRVTPDLSEGQVAAVLGKKNTSALLAQIAT